MGNFIRVTPFMHVPDIEAALAFFNSLGFKTYFHAGTYAYVQRETAAFRVLEDEPDCFKPGNRAYAYYIDVEDIAALIAELKPALDTLPADYVHGPVDQEYGQRELLIRAPDGNLLVFGQTVRA